MSLQSDAYYKAAKKNLKQAEEEYYKPAEDMVMHSACKGSLLAIVDYMKGFLVEHNKELVVDDTVVSLYYKCLEINPNFKKLDIHQLMCKCEPIGSKSCTDMLRITKCFDIANAMELIIGTKKPS